LGEEIFGKIEVGVRPKLTKVAEVTEVTT